MATNKQLKQKAIATVDAAIIILNKYPQLKNTDSDISYNFSTNPFELLLDLFQHTEGYNYLIKIISYFIVWFLPVVEGTIKTLLLEYLKDVLSCSLNPYITDELLRTGVTFDLRDIDLTDKLFESPLSTVGKYYYFGCDDFTIVDEVKNSKDFDCLLWYMKNKATHREVWKKKTTTLESDTKQKKKDGILTLEYSARSNGLSGADGSDIHLQTPCSNCIQVFFGNTREINDSDAIDSYTTENSNLCAMISEINTYIKKANEYLETINQKLIDLDNDYTSGKKKSEIYINERQLYWDQREALNLVTSLFIVDGKAKLFENVNPNSYKNLGSGEDVIYGLAFLWDPWIKTIDYLGEIMNDTFDINNWSFANLGPTDDTLLASYADLVYWATAITKRNQIDQYNYAHNNPKYRSIKKNYYYRKPMTWFNFDYLMSMRLFDSKVVAAQLIDAITGLLSIDLHINIKRQVIKEEVKKMVEMVVESDDTVVSDCFFSFSNEQYDAMVQKAEMTKAGLYNVNGEASAPANIDPEAILELLNGLSDDVSEEEMVSIIAGALTDLSKTITKTTETTQTSVNVSYDSGMKSKVENIIEDTKETKGWDLVNRLLTELADVLVMAVMSPKIYLLLKMNLEVAGQDTNLTAKEFLSYYKQMLVSIIRSIRDQLLKFLEEELMKILGTLSAEVGSLLMAEKAGYFMTLLKMLLDAFKHRKHNESDWDMDTVDYADIYSNETEEETESPNAEC